MFDYITADERLTFSFNFKSIVNRKITQSFHAERYCYELKKSLMSYQRRYKKAKRQELMGKFCFRRKKFAKYI